MVSEYGRLLVPPVQPWFVQSKAGSAVAGGSAVMGITLDALPKATNGLVASIGGGGDAVSGITGGGTWTKAVGSASAVVAELWTCANHDGSTAVVTITFNGTISNRLALITEYLGLATASLVDVSGSATGVTAAILTPSRTPTADGRLAVACATSKVSILSGPIDGWTALASVTSGIYTLSSAYKVVHAVGTRTGWTGSSGDGWDAEIAALKAA